MSVPIALSITNRDARFTERLLVVTTVFITFVSTLVWAASAGATDVQSAPDNASRHITLTVIDAANGNPLPNAVIAVQGSGPAKASETAEEMAQEDHKFVPHVMIVPQHQTVDFPNRDTTRHHVYSFSRAKQFNINLYAGHPMAPIVFDTPGVVELGCNIHDQMQAFIYVTRYAETLLTDANGQMSIAVPPAGPVKLRIWHERLADNTRSLDREIDADDPATFTLSLKVAPPPTNNGPFSDLQNRFDNL